QVGRVEHEDVASGGVGGRPERVGDAALPAMRDGPQPGVAVREAGQHLRRGIPRAIIDDDDLERDADPRQVLAAEARELGEVVGLVLRGHEQGDPDGRGHTRLRIRAGRIPSWSRYFATVRRAIWIPCSANRWTICWSVSGFPLSSS